MSALKDKTLTSWVIDPVDGTGNFARGEKRFGSILALVHKGEVVQSWILDIPGERMGIAEKGAGVQFNGRSVRYSQMDKPLSETRGFISRRIFAQENAGEPKRCF